MKQTLLVAVAGGLLLAAVSVLADENTGSESEANPTPGASEEEANPTPETLQGEEASQGEEVEINLDDLEEEETAASGHPEAGHGHGEGSSKLPKFKLFFDLVLEYELETDQFQFTRDHAHVILELAATDWLTFRTDIAFEPEFYEGIFHLGEKFEVRIGKILVPFGQNDFHHLIGGRVDEGSKFLPVVWGDYGLAFRHYAYNGDFASFDWTFWVINGFSGTLMADGSGEPRPDKDDEAKKFDNNKWKGMGLRPTLGLGRSVTLGTSWYLDAWDQNDDRWMLIYGVDLELGYDLIRLPVLRDLRLRAEIAWAEIKLGPRRNAYHGIFAGDTYGILPNYGMRKAGYNLELSYRILKWLIFRYREGWLNDDTRVADAGDLLVHEPALLATIGPVRFSVHAEILQVLTRDPDPPPTDHSRIYLRILFRY